LLAQGADPTKALGGALLLELAVTHERNAVAEFLRERGIDQSCLTGRRSRRAVGMV